MQLGLFDGPVGFRFSAPLTLHGSVESLLAQAGIGGLLTLDCNIASVTKVRDSLRIRNKIGWIKIPIGSESVDNIGWACGIRLSISCLASEWEDDPPYGLLYILLMRMTFHKLLSYLAVCHKHV